MSRVQHAIRDKKPSRQFFDGDKTQHDAVRQQHREIAALKERQAATERLALILIDHQSDGDAIQDAKELRRAGGTADFFISDIARNFWQDTKIDLDADAPMQVAQALGRNIQSLRTEYVNQPLTSEQLAERLKGVTEAITEAQISLQSAAATSPAEQLRYKKSLLLNLVRRQALEYVYRKEFVQAAEHERHLQGAHELIAQQRLTSADAKKILASDHMTVPTGTTREAMVQALQAVITADTGTVPTPVGSSVSSIEEGATDLLDPIHHPEIVIRRTPTPEPVRTADSFSDAQLRIYAQQYIDTGKMPKLLVVGRRPGNRSTNKQSDFEQRVQALAATLRAEQAEQTIETIPPDVQVILGQVAHQFNDTILSLAERRALTPIIGGTLAEYQQADISALTTVQRDYLSRIGKISSRDPGQRELQLSLLAHIQTLEYLLQQRHASSAEAVDVSKKRGVAAVAEAKQRIQTYDDAIVIFNELQEQSNDTSLLNEVRDEVIRLIRSQRSGILDSADLLSGIEQDIQNSVQAIVMKYYQSLARQGRQELIDKSEQRRLFLNNVDEYIRQPQPSVVEIIDEDLHRVILSATNTTLIHRLNEAYEQIEVGAEVAVGEEEISGVVEDDFEAASDEDNEVITMIDQDETEAQTVPIVRFDRQPHVVTEEPEDDDVIELVSATAEEPIVEVARALTPEEVATHRLAQLAEERRQRVAALREQKQAEPAPVTLSPVERRHLDTERAHLVQQEERFITALAHLQGGVISRLPLIGGLIRRANQWINADRIVQQQAELTRLQQRLANLNELLRSPETPARRLTAEQSVIESDQHRRQELQAYEQMVQQRPPEDIGRMHDRLIQSRNELQRLNPRSVEIPRINERLQIIYNHLERLPQQRRLERFRTYITGLTQSELDSLQTSLQRRTDQLAVQQQVDLITTENTRRTRQAA